MAAVLTAMDREEFWLSELKLKGTLRMASEDAARLAGQEQPGWPPLCQPHRDGARCGT